MVSALDHKNTARLHEVLLRHENPAWPYTTLKEALALVEYLVRLNRIKKSKELSVRLDALTKQSELSWSDVAPRQWENFRSVCQETLRRLSEGQPVRDFLKPLRVIAVFAVGDYTEHPKSFSKGGTVEADEQSFRCFEELTQVARDLQRRYRSGTHAEVCFWFLQERGHSEGALSAERLRLLSEGAQNALLEHVKYIANLDPLPAMHELPSATQLLTNAELAASYIKIKEAVSACRLPTAVKAQYEKVLDFPYITTLPLELVAELTNALEVAAEQGHKPTLHHLSGTAAVEIYTKRVDAVVRHLRTTDGTEQVGRRQEWLPSGRSCSGWTTTLLSKFPSPSKTCRSMRSPSVTEKVLSRFLTRTLASRTAWRAASARRRRLGRRRGRRRLSRGGCLPSLVALFVLLHQSVKSSPRLPMRDPLE
uniref:BY PROTMAP: gi/647400476/emb/CDR45969.1/ RHTO0S11e06854g1_1 [Rhodosporidium toruloides] n=1 Tax=Rhodotorula toruloides TaxID=5286 RepID=A0A0K3CNH7_RHOTO